MSSFWQTWRKEILRGAVLFCAVLAIGFGVKYLVDIVRERVVNRLPAALRDLPGNLDVDLSAGPRRTTEPWTYRARLSAQQSLWIRNTIGPVTVEPAAGDSLEVAAVKSYHRGDPASVQLVAVPSERGVAICALWGENGRCDPEAEYKAGGARHSDVAVDFTVRLPRGVRLSASTVKGAVRVTGATAPLALVTVDGPLDAETAGGPVSAVAVNGGIRARILGFADTGEVSLFTVNGGVTAELPSGVDADVEAGTVNGGIASDFPLSVSGKVTSHRLTGRIGAGGRKVHLTTVNGSITLRKVAAADSTASRTRPARRAAR